MARKKVTEKSKQERAKTKSENFQKLALKRVNAAIGRIRLLKNLANKNSYTYTDAQVQKILTALRNEVDAVEESFQTPEKEQSTGFSF